MMDIIGKQFTLTILVGIIIGSATCQTSSIKVSVYYESLCPDSISFIINELYPNYANFKDRITLDLVPYGKATQTKLVSGEWSFRCQHGFNECRGNKYQACALSQQKGQDKDAKLVNCIMASPDPSDPQDIQTCAVDNGYDWDKMVECYKYELGSDLLAAYGDRTNNLSPKLRFVPTIIFNDQYDQAVQNQCLSDFSGALCSRLSEPKPKVCNS